jgi:hypothetical protein
VVLAFRHQARGDFDARVDFRNAAITLIDGFPGNQVQLNSFFGGQQFDVVRSDEYFGQNIHVWANPPSALYGTQATTVSNGTLRITRVGSHVRGYLDSTMLYENDYNTNDATIWFSLQNNGTRDATAVTFDNFYLEADAIVPGPNLNIQFARPGQVALSWPSWGANYSLFAAGSLGATNLWQPVTNAPVSFGSFLFVTNDVAHAVLFYRLQHR